MGEGEKKPEEKKVEESNKGGEEKKTGENKEKREEPKAEKPSEDKKEEKKTEESKDGKETDSKESKEPPPPQEIVLRVYMHCEGCARKVRRCLRGFEGVEDVQTDCKTHKVVVKGEKADPLKVLDRVQRKSHRQVELLSPIPKPPAEEPKKDEKKEEAKPEEKKEEPQVITVVLKVHMHCEACAQEIRKRIQGMKGVEAADPDLKNSLVTVKGVFDPPKLVEYVYKRTRKHAKIEKQEPEKKEEEMGKEEKEEKKAEGEEKDKGGDGGAKKEEGESKAEAGAGAGAAAGEEEKKVEFVKNEFLYYYPQYPAIYATEYVYPPQIFSDENPNACSVM